MTRLDKTHVTNVQAKSFPFDFWYEWYQKYYRQGLRLYLAEQGGNLNITSTARFPAVLRSLAAFRDSYTAGRLLGPLAPLSKSVANNVARLFGSDDRSTTPLVGEYLFRLSDGRELKVCIDSHDSGELTSSDLAKVNDIYFKTNYWKRDSYDRRVIPLFNCNPIVIEHLKLLRALRNQTPTVDITFIVRVWGGNNEVEGSEHCLRLLEAVAKSKRSKFLLAYLVGGDIKSMTTRLEKAGIAYTMEPIPPKLLWEHTARSRLSIIRLGMHHCVPWRMCDQLALGSCTVLDQHPKTQWTVPLVEGEHYLSLNTSTSPDQPVAMDTEYRLIPSLLEEFLGNPKKVVATARASRNYFDEILDPKQVGRQICETVLSW
ncbi:hypothetical protein [Nitrospira sp. KM1]|uniref:hypothetical protein n=1 Tax=Nitrospira sp. KM1 TaxID=1936990 RepID=UPI001566EBBA|nr:hypothetical protein [Nitrospira sp. KM1]